jgi:hypothetical protein
MSKIWKNLLLICVIILFLPFVAYNPEGQERWEYLTVGPMLHLNFGKNDWLFSFGFEAAFWVCRGNKPPYSIDIGCEFVRNGFRFYTELQAFLLNLFSGSEDYTFLGISAGPVLEIAEDYKVNIGYQGSIWGCFFAGADLRYRRMDGYDYFCPGVFGKMPIAYSIDDDAWRFGMHGL